MHQIFPFSQSSDWNKLVLSFSFINESFPLLGTTQWQNRPVAQFLYIIQNVMLGCKLHRRICKLRKVKLDWCELLCFGSTTMQLAPQHGRYCTMWPDHAKSLFRRQTLLMKAILSIHYMPASIYLHAPSFLRYTYVCLVLHIAKVDWMHIFTHLWSVVFILCQLL